MENSKNDINQELIIETGAVEVLEVLERAAAQCDSFDTAMEILIRVSHRMLSGNRKFSEEQTLARLALFDIAVRSFDIDKRGGDPGEFMRKAGLLPPKSGLN